MRVAIGHLERGRYAQLWLTSRGYMAWLRWGSHRGYRCNVWRPYKEGS